MATSWIEREGKRILYTDFRGCRSEAEIEAMFTAAARIVQEASEPVLTMNNFEGVDVSVELLRKLREGSAAYKHNVKAKAVLGVTGLKRAFINTYSVLTGIEARAFATEDEAVAYLLSA